MLAASVGEYVSRDAEGSGVPELKSILAGVNIYRYLSMQALLGKIIGTWFGFCAGLSIGKLGPFVHIAAGIANKLAKLKAFKDIGQNHTVKRQMLQAAVAVGVTAVFGTPIGGVLLSIELTSSYYMVSNLWKAFFSSIVTVIAFRIFSIVTRVELFSKVVVEDVPIDWQIWLYCLLGVFCGILGSLFISIFTKLVYLRTKLRAPFVSN